MEIAKYIGQFLLKNGFCYLHGLGNLQLRRTPAAYTGDALTPPQYEVLLTHGGSIDDSLAAFIAQGEQTSISKAANALRDFNTATRAELQAGNEVAIPGLGTIVSAGSGAQFRTDPAFQYTPPPVPTVRMSKRTEEEPTFSAAGAAAAAAASVPGPAQRSANPRKPSVAWGKIGLIALLLAAAIAAVVYGLKFLNKDEGEEAAPTRGESSSGLPSTAAPATKDSAPPAVPTPDSAGVRPASVSSGGLRIVLNAYETRERADRRVRFLSTTGVGTAASVLPVDSSRFLVVVSYTGPAADTARVLDSFSRTYGGRATMMR